MTKQSFRLAFMGTPDFAVPALEKLIESSHKVICIYTQPPRPKGRGHKLISSPIQELAETHGIQVRTPHKLKNNEKEKAFLEGLDLDLVIVAAYGLLLPRHILEIPRYGCLNIHASLLPRWRGASPIQQAILHGDEQSGVTIMQMEEGLDSGPILSRQAVPIRPQTTATSLHDELSALGAIMTHKIVDRLAKDERPESKIQDENKATYAPLLTKKDGKINWSQRAMQIERHIRALNPWPGVWTTDRYHKEARKHKILAAELSDIHLGHPQGTLVDASGHVCCGEDTAIKITRIQPAGAHKAMDVLSAINGSYLETGQAFEVD